MAGISDEKWVDSAHVKLIFVESWDPQPLPTLAMISLPLKENYFVLSN